MIKLLAKLFIKDCNNYSNHKVREQYGILCGGFGIFLNLILFVAKIVFGMISSSVAMIADAFNNLSDAASSLVQLLGFKLAGKKPDSEHPFGHGRMEYIAGLIISFLIVMMGVELFKSSLNAVLHPEPVKFSVFSIVIMGIAILVKAYMYLYNHAIGKKINSVSMEAVAKDSLGDVITTFVVIITFVLSRFTTLPLDGIGGLVVACFIFKTGIEAAKETIAPLLGTAPSKEFCKEIEAELLKHKPIVGMHDLIVHDYGPGRLIISLHAEVPGDIDVFELHEVIDVAEYDIAMAFNCKVVIHMDPIDLKNQRLVELKEQLKKIVTEINPVLSIHDVRMVPGKGHSNLIFDLVKPYEVSASDLELKTLIQTKINAVPGCNDIICVATIEAPYHNN